MSFCNDIRTTTRRYVAEINKKNAALAAFEKQKAGYYSPQTFQKKRGELVQEKQDTIEAARAAVQALVDRYKDGLKDSDVLNGSDVTDDAKLLTGAFKLTAADLEAMFDRSSGNRTMLRLIMDYAREHGIFIARTFYTAEDKRDGAETMLRYAYNSFDRPEYADLMDTDEYFEQITPDAVKGE